MREYAANRQHIPRIGESFTMKRSFVLAFAAAWGLCAEIVFAQYASTPARPASYEAYSYYDLNATQASPSDQAAPADKSVQAPPADDSGADDKSCIGLFGHCGQLGPFCHMCWPCGC